MSNYVLVLDANKKPLTPCKPSMARSLLKAGKAAVYRLYPFTIILQKKVRDTPTSCQLKIDPGSKTTGLALLLNNSVIWAGELTHRGQQIKDSLLSRRQMCGTNKYGFPIRHRSKQQVHKGFQTGDIVKAVVTKGQKIGIYKGRVLCRASGSFDISTAKGRVSPNQSQILSIDPQKRWLQLFILNTGRRLKPRRLRRVVFPPCSLRDRASRLPEVLGD